METLAWNEIPVSASSPPNSGIIVDNEVEDCKIHREWLFVEKRYFQTPQCSYSWHFLILTYSRLYKIKSAKS